MLDSELVPAVESRPGGPRPLMVVLHGLGDSVDGWRWFPEAMNLPWLNYLLVNAPDDYFGGFSWFDLDNMVPGVLRSRKLLSALLDDLPAKGFPAEQITLGGFSQGCLMAIDTSLRYPHRLAGIVGISGWVYEPDKLLQELSPVARQQRLILTHGTLDPLIEIDRVRPQIPRLKAAGLAIEWHEFVKEHTVAGEAEISVIRNFVRAGYIQWSDGLQKPAGS
jgi:phospholipase/carboxylesterase